ncbi:leucine-rich repeat extensin-like protein 6 [Mercurialis annua]|uniref:leucine-rich repeat extensin-like protein 6 n=1 Tax=Mercurialis annua TaxID=3986 RepID=UPI00215F3334|nr:leucine-rich repeat extensin-like protein 6 [Mercurialis annua]
MLLKSNSLDFMVLPKIFLVILMIISFAATPILGLESRKLDDTTLPSTPTDVKCAPCDPSPPPPPPPSPCPPPPALPPPVLPPPSPKKPPSSYCPPPPPASFIYITGPPGNLYPIDSDFGGAGRSTGVSNLIGCGLLGILLIIGL